MSLLQDGLQSTDSSASLVNRTGKYLWKHRNKIAVGGAVCAAGIALYAYYSMSTNSSETEEEKFLMSEVKRESQHMKKPGDRSRMLLRIRKQFDFAIRQFLPTMRAKILEVVDVSSAISRIKELRTANADSSLDGGDKGTLVMTEAMLWDEIKVSSLTLLYVSAYMVSAVTVLLRIQLHILGKSMESVVGSQSPEETERSNFGGDDDVFKILIEGTYKHIFGSGLRALSDYVRPRVAECFSEWAVRDKLTVGYDELVRVLIEVHRNIERDSTSLAKMIMLPPEADSGEIDTTYHCQTAHTDPPVQLLLSQTWDVIESPMFAAVFAEAADTCLRSIIENLKKNVFTLPDSEDDEEEGGRGRYRSPPLASLLPQLKTSALRLLPSDPSAPISANVREMLSSTSLDTLCVSLFDLGLPHTSTSPLSNSSSVRNTLDASQKSNSTDGIGRTKDDLNNSATNWPF